MEIKILQVFYDKNGLPYKDKERTVHYPITSGTFLGASNTTQIRFYYDQLDELNESTFVAVSKLPNGKIGSEILESEYDSELQENYVVLNLSQFYTQYKGDVYISLQGYQGGVRVEQDENGIYQIYGTPTIQATGSIKLSIAYAPTFVGSGETENVTLQRVLAELATKLGIRQETLHVEELPEVGNPNVWYVVNDDTNDPSKANIYIWNATTQTYVWVGDNTLDLGNYYTQEQGEQFEQDVRETIGNGSPKGVYATLSDLESAYPTGTAGIYVVSADGHWYYWNGSAWTDGGAYLSTVDAASKDYVDKKSAFNDFELVQGGFNDSGLDDGALERIRTQQFLETKKHKSFILEGNNLDYSISFYSTPNTARTSYIGWTNITSGSVVSFNIPNGANYFRVLIRYRDNTVIAPTDVTFKLGTLYEYAIEQNTDFIEKNKNIEWLLENPNIFYLLSSDFENKGFDTNGQIAQQEDLTRITCEKYFPITDTIAILSKNVNVPRVFVSVSYYRDNLGTNRISYTNYINLTEGVVFTPPSGAKYARFILLCEWNRGIVPTPIYPSDINNLFFVTDTKLLTQYKTIVNSIKEVGFEIDVKSKLEKCYIFGSYIPTYEANGNRISTSSLIRVYGKYANLRFDFSNTSPTYEYSVSFFDNELGSRTSYTDWNRITNNNLNIVKLPEGTTFILVTIRYANNSVDIATTDINGLYISSGLIALEKVNEQDFEKNVYTIGNDLIKKAQFTIAKIPGTALNNQAFCIYNDKIYSIDGNGNLKEQSLSNLSVTNTYTGLTFGHGNSCQLGISYNAYVSGWDDNKIYVLDLSTKTVTNTINLPTRGYTTCVVDEVRNVAYVFQRETYPDTEEYYNFLTIDLLTSRIVLIKKTSIKFGAMQSCDLVNDKIIVAAGLGTNECPNNFMIFDIQGNLIERMFIPTLDSIEPEGIFVDRNGDGIYLSDLSGNFYKINN